MTSKVKAAKATTPTKKNEWDIAVGTFSCGAQYIMTKEVVQEDYAKTFVQLDKFSRGQALETAKKTSDEDLATWVCEQFQERDFISQGIRVNAPTYEQMERGEHVPMGDEVSVTFIKLTSLGS